MFTLEQARSLYGRDVYGTDGDKIGSVGQVWDDGAGQAGWASVRTGLFGLNESFVPLRDADLRDDRLVVPFDKATVRNAPNVDATHEEPLTDRDVEQLYRYYGLNGQQTHRAYQAGTAAGTANYTGDDAMTRSEERLDVRTEREQVGRARLRKHVVTEHQQVNVPVEREEVRLEREPITDVNRDAAYAGPDLTESEHEVTLHADRPVVDTEAVPVERVRLSKETVVDEQTVGGEVRKERIEADLPDGRGRRSVD